MLKTSPDLRGGHIGTPFGKATALVDDEGRLTHFAFPGEVASARWRIDLKRVLWDDKFVAPVAKQIDGYFAKRRREFDLPLAPNGTPFQHKMWSALQRVPFGVTLTYGEFASKLGVPKAARAIGAANGANPISLIIPCHRLIGSTGALHGYAGGLPVKRGLLEFEGAFPAEMPRN